VRDVCVLGAEGGEDEVALADLHGPRHQDVEGVARPALLEDALAAHHLLRTGLAGKRAVKVVVVKVEAVTPGPRRACSSKSGTIALSVLVGRPWKTERSRSSRSTNSHCRRTAHEARTRCQ
jgi:hypothetical protein